MLMKDVPFLVNGGVTMLEKISFALNCEKIPFKETTLTCELGLQFGIGYVVNTIQKALLSHPSRQFSVGALTDVVGEHHSLVIGESFVDSPYKLVACLSIRKDTTINPWGADVCTWTARAMFIGSSIEAILVDAIEQTHVKLT